MTIPYSYSSLCLCLCSIWYGVVIIMHYGTVWLSCTMVRRGHHALWYGVVIMHWYGVVIMHYGTVWSSCTMVRCGHHALWYGVVIMHYGTAWSSCTMVQRGHYTVCSNNLEQLDILFALSLILYSTNLLSIFSHLLFLPSFLVSFCWCYAL